MGLESAIRARFVPDSFQNLIGRRRAVTLWYSIARAAAAGAGSGDGADWHSAGDHGTPLLMFERTFRRFRFGAILDLVGAVDAEARYGRERTHTGASSAIRARFVPAPFQSLTAGIAIVAM